MSNEAITPKANFLYDYKVSTTSKDGTTSESTRVITLAEAVLKSGIWAVEAQDTVLAARMQEMTTQSKTLQDINDAMKIITELKAQMQKKGSESCNLDATAHKKLKDLLEGLKGSCKLSLDGTTVITTKSLPLAEAETLLSRLTTLQSSQGAANEDLSLRLNQAASERSAIFSQLQTLLQTLMQTQRQLSNW